MNTASLLVVGSRLLLLFLAIETLIRYAIWWRRAKVNIAPSIFVPLLLGIVFTMAAFIVTTETSLELAMLQHHSYILPPRLYIAMLLAVVGTIFHVIPCWRLSNKYSNKRIVFEVIWRASAVIIFGWYGANWF